MLTADKTFQVLIADPFQFASEALKQSLKSFYEDLAVKDTNSVTQLAKFAQENSPRIIFIDLLLFENRTQNPISYLRYLFPEATIVVLQSQPDETIPPGADVFINKLNPRAAEQIFKVLAEAGLNSSLKDQQQKTTRHQVWIVTTRTG